MIVPFFLGEKKIMSDDSTPIRETHSYNVCLGHMKKAFKHCSILLVRGHGFSLPFCQALRGVLFIYLIVIMML